MIKKLLVLCLATVTLMLEAATVSIGGRSVSLPVPAGFSQKNEGKNTWRFSRGGETFIIAVRASRERQPSKSEWNGYMNGCMNEFFGAKQFVSEYREDGTVNGMAAKWLSARGDFGSHSQLATVLVLPWQGNDHLLVIGAFSTARVSPYDLDRKAAELKDVLRRTRL